MLQKTRAKTVTKAQKDQLLKELMIDGDWDAAGKRIGLNKAQITYLRTHDTDLAARADKLLGQQLQNEVRQSLDRFRKTQDFLISELENGNVNVAPTLMKSHEIEFRRHGLFEKDNSQKRTAVMINISFDNEKDMEAIDHEP